MRLIKRHPGERIITCPNCYEGILYRYEELTEQISYEDGLILYDYFLRCPECNEKFYVEDEHWCEEQDF